jgi:hypothetical protein
LSTACIAFELVPIPAGDVANEASNPAHPIETRSGRQRHGVGKVTAAPASALAFG